MAGPHERDPREAAPASDPVAATGPDRIGDFAAALIDTLDEHVAVVNLDGTIVAVNRPWRLFAQANGLGDPNHGVGSNYLALCRSLADPEAGVAHELGQAMEQLAAGIPVQFDRIYACHSPQQRRWFKVRAVRLKTDPPTIAIFHRDVTEEAARQQRLVTQDGELRNLYVALARSERVDTLGQMAAEIAHELNQPLGAILNYAGAIELLLQTEAGRDRARQEVVPNLVRCAERAGGIIRRVRDFIGTGALSHSTVSVGELIHDAIALLNHEFQQSAVQVQADVPDSLPAIICDRVQVIQVLVNLLRNAVEAMENTPPADRVIRIQAQMREPATIELQIADRGRGLPPAHATWSGRTPLASDKTGGMGMGLRICQAIVRAHGGRIDATNGHDAGAVFRVSLPMNCSEADDG